jgi:hypothetical protein
MPKKTKKKLLPGLMIIVMLLGLFPVNAYAGSNSEELYAKFMSNQILLDEINEDIAKSLDKAADMKAKGNLPSVKIAFGIKVNSYYLLKGLVNGINIPLVLKINGIEKLSKAMFAEHKYSAFPFGSLIFNNGIMNGSNAVNKTSLPSQSLEAQIAAQEYIIYSASAIQGLLSLVTAAETEDTEALEDSDSTRLPPILKGLKGFLEFDLDVVNEKRSNMDDLLGPDMVNMGKLIKSKRSVKDVINKIDTDRANNYLIETRNTLFGGQTNVDNLARILNYAESIMSEDALKKYQALKDTPGSSLKTLLQYFKEDIDNCIEALQLAEQFDQTPKPLLGDLKISNIIRENIITTLPVLINEQLESQLSGLGSLGAGKIITDMITPLIQSSDVSSTIRILQHISDSLAGLIITVNNIGGLLGIRN